MGVQLGVVQSEPPSRSRRFACFSGRTGTTAAAACADGGTFELGATAGALAVGRFAPHLLGVGRFAVHAAWLLLRSSRASRFRTVALFTIGGVALAAFTVVFVIAQP
jgi:hypothetical protein